ncbi:MAG TPA: NHLP bacteriocin export ABC transporter permease/ATPase subunit [bacterium]|nr:NHLP bacteriocin export ABC transporter permease/ATPase subunit [bacterium]
MKKLIEIFLNEAELLNVSGNEPFIIDGTDIIWFVLKGGVELFSTELFEGEAAGQRFYFCSIEENQIIVGMDIFKNGNGRTLLAVPANQTCLLKLRKSFFNDIIREGEHSETIVSLIEVFLIKILTGLSQDINPRADILCKAGMSLNFNNSQRMRSEKGLIWIKFIRGQGIFLDIEYVPNKDAENFYIPLSQDSWITASQDGEIEVFSTRDIIDDIWTIMGSFENKIFLCEYLNRNMLKADELNRLREKILYNEKTYKNTFSELSAIFEDEYKSVIAAARGDALLAACRLIGNDSGIRIEGYARDDSEIIKDPDEALKEIAKTSRIRIRTVKLEGEWRKKDIAPLLCFIGKGKHPAAILKLKNKNIVYDAAANEQKVIDDETSKSIYQTAYCFYKPLPEKIISGIDALKFAVSNIKKELRFVIIMGIITGFITGLIPLAAQYIINTAIPEQNYSKLFSLGAALLFASISGALFEICRNVGLLKVEAKIDYILQASIIDRLLKLPVSFFYKYSAGDLSERALSVFTIRQILSGQTVITALGIIFAGINLILLFYFSAVAAVGALAVIFIAILINIFGNYLQLKYLYPAINLEGKISGMLFQFIGGIGKIKVARAEIHSFANWVSKFGEQQKLIIKSRAIFNALISFNQILPVLLTLVLFLIIDFFKINNFGNGEFAAFNAAMTSFVYAMTAACSSIMMLVHVRPLYDRIKPILNEPLEIGENKINAKKFRGNIEVCNVSYKYSSDGPIILDNISFNIKPGEYVAIVGPSGSGKSTLLKLMLGFDKPLNGAILYDKQDLSVIDLRTARRQFGVILQDSQLAQGDILSNIIGSKKLTFEDAWAAAGMAGIDKDIEEMPMGMKTAITVGSGTFSGGQKQRILIARALVSKPRIIFFDEATSALDNRSQSIVIENLEKLQSTRIVIAHRLSSIIKADKIFVMENGRIVQSGTYSSLINQSGLFKKMAERQQTNFEKN